MRLAATLLSLVLPLSVLGHSLHSEAHAAVRHAQLSKRASGDISLHKRYSDARWTYYAVGRGACGKYNVPSDYIVALNSAQYGGGYPGPNCFKTITMTYNGKTAQATIMDECPGCPWGGLDLSLGLFTHFADESAGVIYGTWTFNDDSGSDSAPATTTKHTTYVAPKTTSTKKTTTWEPAPTTTTEASTTTSSSHTSSSAHSSAASSSTVSSLSSSATSASSSSSSAPSASTPSATPGSNLGILANAFEDLGQVVLAAVAAE
ncbi:hypothetical protein H0H93_005398 [Arthromyces matolae]|nr:hypothetical protein H0H93_005398 [Arthromyces matolae]